MGIEGAFHAVKTTWERVMMRSKVLGHPGGGHAPKSAGKNGTQLTTALVDVGLNTQAEKNMEYPLTQVAYEPTPKAV